MSDSRASAAVTKAIRSGVLPPVTTQTCVDCGAVATAYDHYKGYARENWLDVQPVCARHNALRTRARGEAAAIASMDQVDIILRLPGHLVVRLDAEAREQHRSRNSQLHWILRERYAKANGDVVSDGEREGEDSDERSVSESRGAYVWAA